MPSDSEVINAHIRSAAADQHTSIPARVVSFDGVSVTVSADIDQQLSDGSVLNRGQIVSVPVQFAGTSDTLMSFPLKAGHTGMLVFQERSMDEWLTQGADNSSVVAAKDRRMHDYNDCVFVPGVAPHSKAKSSGVGHTFPHNPQTDTVMKHNIGTAAECMVKMGADGAITIQNQFNTMNLAADGTLTVTCKILSVSAETSATIDSPEVTVTCENITVDCDTATVTAGGDVNIEATGDIALDAVNVAITSTTLKHNAVNVGYLHTHFDITNSTPFTGTPV